MKTIKDGIEIYKCGNVELLPAMVEDLYNRQMYICTYSRIYKIEYSVNVGYYFSVIYTKPKTQGVGITKRGRWNYYEGYYINKLVGFELVHKDIY